MLNFEPHFEPDVTLWILAASCISGLFTALLMRKSEGSSLHGLSTCLFYGSLLAVGLTAICFIGAPSGLSLFPPMTLGVMIVGATWDFRSTPVQST
jgi:hypothetical protein